MLSPRVLSSLEESQVAVGKRNEVNALVDTAAAVLTDSLEQVHLDIYKYVVLPYIEFCIQLEASGVAYEFLLYDQTSFFV